MVASLIGVCEAAGMSRPYVLFWGHEPRPATGWTDPERVGSYVYNTATGEGLGWRVLTRRSSWRRSAWASTGSSPGTGGYDRAGRTGLLSAGDDAAEASGLRLYRLTLYAFCEALETDRDAGRR